MRRFKKGDRVTAPGVPGMGGVWVVVRNWSGKHALSDKRVPMVEVEQGRSKESVGEDDLQPFTGREPGSLTGDELVEFVRGLRVVMYGDVGPNGGDVWNPDMNVSGADLVDWINEEFTRLGLVPRKGRRKDS